MASETAAATKPDPAEMVQIYHVEGRRSQRVIWLCEELNIPYEAIFKRGDTLGSLNAIKAVNPAMPMAPTVVFRGKTMVETGAIIEYLMSQFPGGDALAPPISSPDFADYKMWMHFAEGTAANRIHTEAMRLIFSLNKKIRPAKIAGIFRIVGAQEVVDYVESHISTRAYFAGDAFSAADIMMEFVATYVSALPFEQSTYRNLETWRQKVRQRPAYQRAQRVGLPDGEEALRRSHSARPKLFQKRRPSNA